ncbi:MAG: adenylyl-sulfate reductase subunit beta, partial [Candidatus Marinimicrobia bacterium]|nr:adenylyl-sulfate reductase subunit beta [Candidatus Neomarinimicrobiota bacterium]
FVPMGGQVHPMRSSDSIMWTVKFRNGNLKRFKFPIRTTAEGAANDYAGQRGDNLDDENLLLEADLPAPQKLA